MDKLAERALYDRVLSSRHPGKAVEMIESLGKANRLVLEGLKSEDIQDVRWPR